MCGRLAVRLLVLVMMMAFAAGCATDYGGRVPDIRSHPSEPGGGM